MIITDIVHLLARITLQNKKWKIILLIILISFLFMKDQRTLIGSFPKDRWFVTPSTQWLKQDTYSLSHLSEVTGSSRGGTIDRDWKALIWPKWKIFFTSRCFILEFIFLSLSPQCALQPCCPVCFQSLFPFLIPRWSLAGLSNSGCSLRGICSGFLGNRSHKKLSKARFWATIFVFLLVVLT